MILVNQIKKLMASKGFLYLFTRFFGSKLRRESFDQYYKSGRWDYLDNDHSAEMVKLVEQYAKKGRILDIGCGPGLLASLLNPDSFEYYLGIDTSTEAIALAQKRKQDNICFEIGDIQGYNCKNSFDVIVFEESLYYVPFFRYRLLKHYSRQLRPNGLFVVTVADPKRFRKMIRMIRRRFHVVEDRCFTNARRMLLVFSLA